MDYHFVELYVPQKDFAELANFIAAKGWDSRHEAPFARRDGEYVRVVAPIAVLALDKPGE